MKVVVHYPRGPDEARVLSEQAAAVHAQAIARYLEKLGCPREQKLLLIQKLEESIEQQG